ncbi:HD domain-containing protein [Haloimpatiens lingqiaonensis]|uniref:HD domain-containing protein n=1 Tax=Haloimpatiens lingqiaonensis TaxID=1380675 RepID=UPI0010FD5DC9|nr:HD domain-containing protein [Haloimpatiens lingqiaonensis]
MITRAIELALKAHENKKRIGTDIPYAVHPIEVGITLSKNKMDDETIIAGIIHDAVEQEYLSLEEVEEMFGFKVKRIVEKVYIADKYQEGEDYIARKKRTLDYLREQASPEFKFVTCADRLSNLKMMQDEYKVIGDKVWDRYKEGYEKRKWYYQSLVVSLTQISNYDMYKEMVERIEDLFGPVSASIFINDDLQTIEDKFDMDVAEQSRWLIEHMMGFLGQVIEEFDISKDPNIKEDLREAMIKILDMYRKQNNNEEIDISHEDWVNCIKIFYILRRFFKFNNTWIRENIGINYLAWYKLYDTEFKLKIK